MHGRTLGLFLVALIAISLGSDHAHASRPEALSLINRARARQDLRPLAADASLTRAAGRHAASMAASSDLSSDGLVRSPEVRARRGRLSVMVGAGNSVPQVVKQLLASSFHRRSLLGRFSVAGVGTAYGHGRIWVAVVVASSTRSATAQPRRPKPAAVKPSAARAAAVPSAKPTPVVAAAPVAAPAAPPAEPQRSGGIFVMAAAALALTGGALARSARGAR